MPPIPSQLLSTSVVRPRTRRRGASASVMVGVLSGHAAAIATDSLHVRVGDRAAGVVGVAEVGRHATLGWVERALAEATTLPAVSRELVAAAGPDMRDAYLAWREVVGSEPEASEFLSVIVVSAEAPTPAAVELWAAETNGVLILEGSHTTPTGHPVVVAGGAVDAALLGHTEFGRLTRHAAVLQGLTTGIPEVPYLRGDASGAVCERHARDLVREQIARQASTPSPAWGTAEGPALETAIHSVVV